MAHVKSTRHAVCFVFAVLLAACASSTTVPTSTQEDQAALCIQAITTTRKAATALLRADKITIEKDQSIQASLDLAVPGCKLLVVQGVKP